ncbi:MAG: cation diffusion facilitator family transporter [Verrucomicrobium sp.]|nr:cation diffusion facilitator family transporter [Verrucomicrobium sp.]
MGHDHDHNHDHACGHDHHGHDHEGHHHHHGYSHAAGVTDEGRLARAFWIIFAFMILEVAGGLFSGSLALLADAGHMISDAIALGMSWAACRLGRRPADAARSYGYKRLEVLVAFVNGCTLLAVSAWILWEAAYRFRNPSPVLGGPMLGVAVAGLLANVWSFLILHGGSRENLNMRSAWLHVLGDLIGSVLAIAAAGIILGTGWSPIDPLLSIAVALVIVKGAWGVVRSAAHILLEGAPEGLDISALRAEVAALPGVADVHHVHAWSMTMEEALVTLHVRCAPGGEAAALVPAIHTRLRERFGIAHVTVQVDPDQCPDAHHGHA